MNERKIVSALQYAKIRGCSEFSVRSAIERGDLHGSLVVHEKTKGKNAKVLIDVEKANKEWPVGPRELDAKNKDKLKEDRKELEQLAGDLLQEEKNKEEQKEVPTAIRYNLARALREEANAKMADLKLKQAAGELIEVDKIRELAFKAGRIVRDQILTIPDRISSDLAAETNQFKVYQTLSEELKSALISLEEAFKDL